MSDFDAAAKMFREIGPMLEADAVIELPETRSWGVKLKTGLAVSATYDPGSASLYFEVPLGPVPEEGRATAHEFLLRMSYLWRDTGGVHGAIGDDDEAFIIHHRPVQGLGTTKLQILLENLGRCAEAWAVALATADDGTEEAIEADTDPNSPSFVGIRV